MLIPYNTDAPLYHFPWGSIGLIVVNTIIFITTAQMDPEEVRPWILVFGDGLHPVQWLTNNFLHADFMHLLGNMFYLWGFGLVVEGKLGWWRFLLLYVSIGIVYGAILQICMLHSEGGALGASGVIYGLLAMALIWAPSNEMSCWLWIGFAPRAIELSIMFFATLYLLWEFGLAWLSGFSMSSQILHLTGAAIGAVAGIVLLKFDWVDCEGWDVFAVLAGREHEKSEKQRIKATAKLNVQATAEKPSSTVQAKQCEVKWREQVQARNAVGAAEAYDRLSREFPSASIAESDLIAFIMLLHETKSWSASIRPMVDYLRRFPEKSVRMRLKLAQILTTHENRPSKALQVLAKIPPGTLDEKLEASRQKLLAHAERAAEEGELEIQDDSW